MGEQIVWIVVRGDGKLIGVYGEKQIALNAIAGKPKQFYKIIERKVLWR